MRSRILAIIAAVIVAWPGVAAACAVCFSGRTDETRIAFAVTTLFMTLLPLVVIASMAWWLRRRAQALRPVPQAVQIEVTNEKLAS